MIYGFTGTSRGMTTAQRLTCLILFTDATIFHHGGCIGSDAEAHAICLTLHISAHVHPCNIPSMRALLQEPFTIYPPRAPLKRNHDIVDNTSTLIATPRTTYEVLRSGTWATIRYARKMKRKIIIVGIDGKVL